MEKTLNETNLIPYINCMTTKMVADFYGVSTGRISIIYKDHKKELDDLGTKVIPGRMLESLLPGYAVFHKTYNNSAALYEFSNGVKVSVCANKNTIFPKAAVERINEFLVGRGRKKQSKELKPEIISEQTSESKEIIFESDEEKNLCLELAKAFSSGDTLKVLNAALNLDMYRIKSIEALKSENKSLSDKIDSMVGWNERASISKIVKALADILETPQKDVWNKLYIKLTMSHKLPLEERKKFPLINAVESKEWPIVYKAINDICTDKYLDAKRVFEKAGVDIAGLERVLE